MKNKLLLLWILFAVFVFSGVANADPLEIIGTATDGGPINEKLIYEVDQGLVWLDYTKDYYDWWENETAWAAGLNNSLSYNFNLGINVSWEVGSGWRLPSISEMVHLYYDSLGRSAGGPLGDPTPFEHLLNNLYWSSTVSSYGPPISVYHFNFEEGTQGTSIGYCYAIAVRSGVVNPVPEPATMLLLGSGLIGLAGYGRKKFFKK